MADKIFRDPLYNYVCIDRSEDSWLVELIDTPEIQRLRRIHQLGVSNFVYPGAEHNRFSHSLGVLHLMQQALQHAKKAGFNDAQVRRAREPLLAAALLHDVGHAPFSHCMEACLDNVNHETWTARIVEEEDSRISKILKRARIDPKEVVALINQDPEPEHAWMKNLISSQLDVDRLDYLRRDSLFTGAGYGHFDFFRLLHTFELYESDDHYRDLIWGEKARHAIEEYIFSRFYMYQNVYMHKTTRGYEKILHMIWKRAKSLREDGTDVRLLGPIEPLLAESESSVEQYLAVEEFLVFAQIQRWTEHSDPTLSDLARRFLHRNGFACIEAPEAGNPLDDTPEEWEEALKALVAKSSEFETPDAYVLRDNIRTKVYEAYTPEPEPDDVSLMNAIRLRTSAGDEPVEISELLPRLKAVTNRPERAVRYYVPKEVRRDALQLRKSWARR